MNSSRSQAIDNPLITFFIPSNTIKNFRGELLNSGEPGKVTARTGLVNPYGTVRIYVEVAQCNPYKTATTYLLAFRQADNP